MTGSLKQMNISYRPEEDRLLLRVSTSSNSEFRVWLTRRFTALLLKVLGEQMDKEGGAAKVASNPSIRDQLRQGAFDQPYEEQPKTSYPLGENGILAYRINAGEAEGNMKLQLLPEDGQGLNLSLDKPMLYMLHSLLEQGLSGADWNLRDQGLEPENVH